MLKLYWLISLLIFSPCFLHSQNSDTNKLASPFTAGHYVPGIWNVRDYVAPVPGFYLIDHNSYLWGKEFYDAEGNRMDQIATPGGTVDLNVDLTGYLNIPTFLYVSKLKFIGARYVAGITTPFSTGSSNVAYDEIARLAVDSTVKSSTITGHASGFGDIIFIPFGLSWGNSVFNLRIEYSLVAPTGKYTPGGGDNVGRGYWTNTFQMFGYYYPMKRGGKHIEKLAVMGALTYEVNSKIKDLDLTPGNRLTAEYGLSLYLNRNLELGIMGGNNFQITDDKGSDVWWNPSNHDQMGYAGVQIGYWLFKEKFYTAIKYNVDYGLKERIKENMILFNFIFSTGWLTAGRSRD